MEWWQLLTGIFGVIGMIYAGLHVYFKNRSSTKVESFKSIMEESKRFREEIREELNQVKEESKKEIGQLQEKIRRYEYKIRELEERLKEALTPRTWLYYYIQKPVKLFEIETILKRHLTRGDSALIVEDDPYTQKVVDGLAQANGWTFLRAYNGITAIDALKVNQPKIIIIDLVLPVADGFEVLNAIHENKNMAGVPIVVISSSNLKEVDRLFLHSKINESLTKA
jgi:CheY-like chemotaxis protein/uncharacterized coiled-coil protein SlyX